VPPAAQRKVVSPTHKFWENGAKRLAKTFCSETALQCATGDAVGALRQPGSDRAREDFDAGYSDR